MKEQAKEGKDKKYKKGKRWEEHEREELAVEEYKSTK
jgi:hypothetical protein